MRQRGFSSGEWLEVVDPEDRPLAVMTREAVHQRCLLHRSVFVLLYNEKGKLYLQKRQTDKDPYAGCWDLSAAGHVLAGEARIEAAGRELYEELRVEAGKLHPVIRIPGCKETGYEFATLFRTGPCRQLPEPNPAEVAAGMFVERHELDYLVQNYFFLLTPALVSFWRKGVLYSRTARS